MDERLEGRDKGDRPMNRQGICLSGTPRREGGWFFQDCNIFVADADPGSVILRDWSGIGRKGLVIYGRRQVFFVRRFYK